MRDLPAVLVNAMLLSLPLTAMVWVTLRLIPRRSLNAATRYLIWWAALAIVALLPVFLVSEIAVPAVSPAAAQAPAFDAAPVGAGSPILVSPTAAMPLPAWNWIPWLGTVWAVISFVLVIRLVFGYAMLARCKRDSLPLLARVDYWMERCGATGRRLRVAGSQRVAVPTLAGIVDPVILIPAKMLEQLSGEELDLIGIHETAHVARWDDFALLVQRLMEAVFALHPAVRWISRQIDLEREIACDDLVVQATDDPRSYARCLARVTEMAGNWSETVVAASVVRRSHLAIRVERLLDKARPTRSTRSLLRLAAAVCVLVVVAGAATRAPRVVSFTLPVAGFAPPQWTFAPMQAALLLYPQAAPSQPPPVPNPPAVVRVPVTVTDPLHRYVTGLEQEHFQLFEDGVEQKITEFTNDDSPVFVGVVAHLSSASSPMLDQALEQFRKVGGRTDFLATIRSQAALGVLSDGIRAARAHLQRTSTKRQAIIVVSDSDTLDAPFSIAFTSATVFVISPTSAALLKTLADVTGARHFGVDDITQWPEIFARIGVELRNQYILGYSPVYEGTTPRRVVEVKLTTPRGFPQLNVFYGATSTRPGR